MTAWGKLYRLEGITGAADSTRGATLGTAAPLHIHICMPTLANWRCVASNPLATYLSLHYSNQLHIIMMPSWKTENDKEIRCTHSIVLLTWG